MAGAVGKDGFAADALALLDDAGTDLSLVKHVDGPTGTALILVGGDGENMIAVVPGANGLVTAADAETAVGKMSEGDILMLQLEVPVDAVECALSEARVRGVTSILNLAPLTPDAPRLGRLADIVIANETEFERLAGQDGMDAEAREAALHRLHQETGQTLIVTLGGDGVIAIRNGVISRAQGLKIEPVDTVGAGDTFCGYFTASLDEGLDFASALRRAAVAGSLACLKAGAQPSIPLSQDVADRI
ncbi:ribokinase [Rhizobium leguminosarum bv. phaseoli CCGM1]|nr:ribokinase [Rhizobium leguminosarum bv. phaseoli CCGM1]